jgi:hypothetical protein
MAVMRVVVLTVVHLALVLLVVLAIAKVLAVVVGRSQHRHLSGLMLAVLVGRVSAPQSKDRLNFMVVVAVVLLLVLEELPAPVLLAVEAVVELHQSTLVEVEVVAVLPMQLPLALMASS